MSRRGDERRAQRNKMSYGGYSDSDDDEYDEPKEKPTVTGKAKRKLVKKKKGTGKANPPPPPEEQKPETQPKPEPEPEPKPKSKEREQQQVTEQKPIETPAGYFDFCKRLDLQPKDILEKLNSILEQNGRENDGTTRLVDMEDQRTVKCESFEQYVHVACLLASDVDMEDLPLRRGEKPQDLVYQSDFDSPESSSRGTNISKDKIADVCARALVSKREDIRVVDPSNRLASGKKPRPYILCFGEDLGHHISPIASKEGDKPIDWKAASHDLLPTITANVARYKRIWSITQNGMTVVRGQAIVSLGWDKGCLGTGNNKSLPCVRLYKRVPGDRNNNL